MRLKLKYRFFILSLFIYSCAFSQEISLYQQFNGHYDYTFIGNTMNTEANNLSNFCTILTTSSAVLNLASGNTVEKAYLYWAGSGTGDFTVKLNAVNIVPDRTFSRIHTSNGTSRNYFGAFADVTRLVSNTGNATYTLSDLDLRNIIPSYCTNATNFAGWAIVIVYKNDDLPQNQLNIYDGLESVPNEINITLDNLNVISTENASVGFIAWEGDSDLAIGETLSINDRTLSNLPLNPENNAFNGTNTFTQSNRLFNMDLDVYSIEPYIHVGDQSANIRLKSGRDVVFINTVVTKLNSQLPDATVVLDDAEACIGRDVTVNYTVSNLNATKMLPSGTKVALYLNGAFLLSTQTRAAIAIDGSESGQIFFTLPNGVADTFDLQLIVDDNGFGVGNVNEISEDNNKSEVISVTLSVIPAFNVAPDINVCNNGLRKGIFNFSNYDDLIKTNPADGISFHRNLADAESGQNPILNTHDYEAPDPTEIFARIDNGSCHAVTSFVLTVKNCPPIVYNYISANHDGANDFFLIKGLRDVFLGFKLVIFNRWGQLIWTGNNNSPDWDGDALKGFVPLNGKVPDGTYFYILELNDPDYPAPLTGYLYFKK